VQSGPRGTQSKSARDTGDGSTARELRRALDEWIAATNGRDIQRQMAFYAPTLQAFYLTRNTPRSGVRAEKQRAFSTARDIDIRAAEPEIVFQESGRVAVMRFRKQYRIVDRSRTRSGEVVQELRWRLSPNGWRIFSERDVKVIR
jgi:ketosteroid isomerase-like protein